MSESEETKNKKAEGAAKHKDPKRRRNRWIAVGVIVVVVVIAGVGLMKWHDTPGFCGAICHTPMDAYVATYTEGNVDKYGNDLDATQSKGMMSRLHEELKKGDGTSAASCIDCHEPSVGEQVTEGMHWVTGNVETAGENKKGDTILESRSFDQLTAARGAKYSEQLCLKSGCHVNADGSDMQRSDLVKATAGLSRTRNPHVAQHGELACETCHKGHSQSINYCSQCHTDAPIPEGWLSWSEAKEKGLVK